MHKDKRLQIRVTADELEGIGRRARAAGLSIAEYGRTRLLAGDVTQLPEQVSMTLESQAEMENGESEYMNSEREALEEECNVEGVPSGVRCFECGKVH